MKFTRLTSILAPLMLVSSQPQPHPEPAQLVATDSIGIAYRDSFDQIAPHASGLTIVMISPNDITDKADNYLNYNWNSFFPDGCDDTETKESPEANALLEKAGNRVTKILLERGIVTPEVIKAINKIDKNAFQALASSIALDVLSNDFSSRVFSDFSPYFRKKTALIVVPEFFDVDEQIAATSGMTVDYLKNMTATKRDWILWILGHEIKGHAENMHSGETVNYCTEIDHKYLQQTFGNEAEADINASRIFKIAQEKGFASKAQLTKSIWAYRTLGAFYSSSNFITSKNTGSVQGHITSFNFDYKSSDFKSSKNLKNSEAMVEIPLLINSYADAFAVFLYIQEIKQKISVSPQNYTEKDKKFYATMPNNPAEIIGHFEDLADLGNNLRISDESGAAMYEYHYAAMSYMRDHGWLQFAKNSFDSDLYASVEDLFNDYFEATELEGAKKLTDPIKVSAMNAALKSFHDYNAIFNIIAPPQEAASKPSPEPTS